MSQTIPTSDAGGRIPSRALLVLAAALGVGLMAALWAERGIVLDRSEPGLLMESIPDRDPYYLDARVNWRFEPDAENGGAIIAEIGIAERREMMTITIRPNDDEELPASHVIEVVTPNKYPERQVTGIGGIFVKTSRADAGLPLIGTSVTVADGVHWFALSGVRLDRQQNLNLLTRGEVFQVNLTFANGGIGGLGFEKGAAGRAAFDQALAAWQ